MVSIAEMLQSAWFRTEAGNKHDVANYRVYVFKYSFKRLGMKRKTLKVKPLVPELQLHKLDVGLFFSHNIKASFAEHQTF